MHQMTSTIICKECLEMIRNNIYCQTSNISQTLVGNKIADHSDVVGASPIDASTTSFST